MTDVTSFRELGVSPDIVDALEKRGITRPFPVQAMTIPPALEGRDICGKAKTGSGKTLAFGIPMVELLQRGSRSVKKKPRGLVLVPTRELAQQVATELAPLAEARGLQVTTVYGGASIVTQMNALLDAVDIVIATPGRFIDVMQRGMASLDRIETVVLDEADHMADLGFLPQVDKILRRVNHAHQTVLFSATLDGMVDTLVRNYMNDPVLYEVASTKPMVDTMKHRFISVMPHEQAAAAAAICRSAERVLVFVRTQHRADRVAEQLSREGIKADPIHGGLRQSQREQTLDAFTKGNIRALVATNVAARGLHVEGVDIVLHYDPPEDHKTYLHRSGRTARAGEAGLVVTFASVEHLFAVKEMQELAGLNHPIEPMRADDPRLSDLAGWEPAEIVKEEPKQPRARKRGPRGSVGSRRKRMR